MEKREFNFSRCFNMKKFYDSYMTKAIQDSDISVGCLVFLKALSSKDFHSQQELSEYISCNKAHTSRILTKLQEKDLIKPINQKTPANLINLTEKGKRFARLADELNFDYVSKIVENIDEKELSVFMEVFNQIYTNAETLNNK